MKNNCFELFGFDFIIDTSFAVWLIEVNTNPCLEESSQFLTQMLQRMAQDTLKVTVDIAFQEKVKLYYKKNFLDFNKLKTPQSFENYDDYDNMWEEMPECKVDCYHTKFLAAKNAAEQAK